MGTLAYGHFQPMLLAAAIGIAAPAAAQAITLAPVFSDNMVIQRGVALPVWGWARPHDRLQITLGSDTATIIADRLGQWRAAMPAQHPGKPLTLTVESPRERTRVTNIAVGDVYLCSGQSNMAFSVQGSTGGGAAIATASDLDLRLLAVPQASAPRVQQKWPVAIRWRSAAPDTVASFSAACYFMGRELRRGSSVPIGLISAAVGGSAIQAWLSPSAYRQSGGDPERQMLVELSASDPIKAQEKWDVIWKSWWQGATGSALGSPWHPDYRPDRRWLPEEPGKFWDQWHTTDLPDGRGMAWFRTTVQLTDRQASQEAILELGAVRELDKSWVNGRAVGSTYGADAVRAYPIPAGTLHAGDNSVALAIDSRWMAGGFSMDSPRRIRFSDGSSQILENWRYRAVPGWIGYMPRPPWNRLTGPTVLFNGMIAPLSNFPVRAVAWYQGEQNGDDAGEYQQLLTAFMADWRNQFGASTAFMIIQLPNFGTRDTDYPNVNWAWLREAQRLAVLSDKAARLIVTIDVGESSDIHPRDKLTVGLRLAAAAQSTTGSDFIDIVNTATGPYDITALSLGRNHVFATLDGAAPSPFLACSQARGTCRLITAELSDNLLYFKNILKDEDSIRYCWAENPRCNLYDKEGNPLTPFEIHINNNISGDHN